MTVVVDDGGTEEVAEVAEAVAEAVADVAETVAEAVAEAVEDGAGGGQTVAEEIDRWVDVENRFNNLDRRLDDLASRPTGVTYDEVREIVASVAVPVAAEVAEEVAEEVADETASGDDDTPDEEITIVAPDVSATEERVSRWHPRTWW